MPPEGVTPEEGETRDFICGHFRIFQYAKGHRYSTDDVLTAWYGTTCAPSVSRAADLGSGIGSVATIVAWRLPGATIETVEAQELSVRLARKSVRYNGLESRVTIHHGDLRDFTSDAPFDLVTGSPPYWPRGTATEAEHPQAIPARVEVRGSVADYARTASRILAPGGIFAFVFPHAQLDRAMDALRDADLRLVRRRDVSFKEDDPPLISLFAATRRDDIPSTYEPWIEPPLTIRRRDGGVPAEYSAIRMSFGFPPGNVPA
ncbi:MAG TPA: methyltransferase [Thermoanaerobaculia bacterium]|nr:methyltransferase [Thermoanaerobaculia bacterium]